MNLVTNIRFEPGYIYLDRDAGPPTRYNVSAILRALDIPTGLTYTQVAAVTTLANLVVILIRTLIDRDVLGEDFLEGGEYNLDDIETAITLMGGSYMEPDLTVD